jgi:hypothetical protein
MHLPVVVGFVSAGVFVLMVGLLVGETNLSPWWSRGLDTRRPRSVSSSASP